MKQVPEQYLAPVQEFLNYVIGSNNYSDAAITGGLIRDLTLGKQPKDTDVLIKTSMTVEELTAVLSKIKCITLYDSYAGGGHFDNSYKLLAKDRTNNIDYLFIQDHLSINKVIDSFDCSLNKGYALPHLGIIYPPNLEIFTYDMVVGNIERFEKFTDMFNNYHEYKVYSNDN